MKFQNVFHNNHGPSYQHNSQEHMRYKKDKTEPYIKNDQSVNYQGNKIFIQNLKSLCN